MMPRAPFMSRSTTMLPSETVFAPPRCSFTKPSHERVLLVLASLQVTKRFPYFRHIHSSLCLNR